MKKSIFFRSGEYFIKLSIVLVFFTIHPLVFSQILFANESTEELVYRDIQIGNIKNKSSASYGYIGDFIKTNLIDSLKKLPYITITEEERKFLADEIGIAESEISMRLRTRIISDKKKKCFFPIYIEGEYSFDRKTGFVLLKIMMENKATGLQKILIDEKIPLDDLFSEPDLSINKAVKNLVRYKIYTINLKANQENAELFVDRNYAGRGSVNNYYILPGYHTFSAKLKGYLEHSEVMYIDKDNLTIKLSLNTLHVSKTIPVITEPPDTHVYLNETLIGKTPIDIPVISKKRNVLFLKKEGYKTKLLLLNENIIDGNILNEQTEKKYRFSINLVNKENIPLLVKKIELHKKKAKLYSYLGMGFLGVSIILGSQKTIQDQKADIYRNMGNEKYRDAEKNSNILQYLTWGTSGITVAIFGKSFLENLKYFKGYKDISDTGTLFENSTSKDLY